MFGSKQGKRARLAREVALFHEQDEISIEEMARQFDVDRATIEKDLVSLNDAGVVLHEGRRGKLGLAEWVRKKSQRR